eukprot:2576631-Karenia_brevis.AAC.1
MPRVAVDWSKCENSALSVESAEEALKTLRDDSATGPDLLPTRILKQCAGALALPVYLLAIAVLKTGVWPAMW